MTALPESAWERDALETLAEPLGWLPLVDDLVASGQLVALFDEPVTTARGYFLVCPPARPEAPAAPAFRRWLFSACAASAVAAE